ncbi:MAG: hypothetical protein NZ695_02805 [Dehalococcoidia bacterium]|jgi:ABC-type cobalt transport system substrate-binding protein|nr:hypothetical protein [Dehalococcoidia bacterium]MDW8009708.1 hypothetical protein [Chloroflexota bacterium]
MGDAAVVAAAVDSRWARQMAGGDGEAGKATEEHGPDLRQWASVPWRAPS